MKNSFKLPPPKKKVVLSLNFFLKVILSGEEVAGESYYSKFRIGDPPSTAVNTLDDVDIPQQPPNWILHVDQFGRTSAKAGN